MRQDAWRTRTSWARLRHIPPVVRDRQALVHHLATMLALQSWREAGGTGRIRGEGGNAISQLVFDAALPAKLLSLSEPAELVDADGNLVGRFEPAADVRTYRLPIGDDELRRREQPGRKKYTPEEVLERLRKLP